jgi:uncharacterized membrane protein
MWVSHHELMRLVRRVDYQLLFANGFLLLLVTFVPFPTAVLAQYLGAKSGSAAVAFYCLSFFVISIAFKLLLAAITYKRRLVRPDVADGVLSRIRRAYWVGPVAYGAAAAASYWNASVGLVIRAPLSKSPAIFSVRSCVTF